MPDSNHDTLLKKAVDDREAHPWRYYRLEFDQMKRICDRLSEALEARDAQIEQLKGTISQLGDAFWLAEQTRLHDELTKVTTRQHEWEFYANGSFCRKCGAQIGSGLPCR